MQRFLKFDRLALAAILALAALLRLPHLDYGLPELYKEATPMRQAWEMWGWDTGKVDFNPHFFKYPSFSFYVQFIGQAAYLGGNLLAGRFGTAREMAGLVGADPSELILLGRWITALFGLGAVWALYRLGRSVEGPGTGLLAAGLLAVLPVHVAASRMIAVDPLLVFFGILALNEVFAVLDGGGKRRALLCGLWIGLAASSKYTGALFGLPLLVAFALRERQDGGHFLRGLLRPELWLGAGTAAAVFLATSPYCLLDFPAFWRDFTYERTHMAVGHFGRDPQGTAAAYWNLLREDFGVFAGGVALVGAAVSALRARWIPVWGFCALYVGIVLTWATYSDHYLLPAYPCLALLAARGIWTLDGVLRRRLPGPAGWSAGLLGLALVLPGGVETAREITFFSVPDTRTRAKAWIDSNVEPGAVFAMEYYTPNLDGQTYPTVRIPMVVIRPEAAAPCYRMEWFADCDYVVTSSEVADRYRAQPERFAAQARFYGALAEQWPLVQAFAGGKASGPTVRIFRNPNPGERTAGMDSTLFLGLQNGHAQVVEEFLGGFIQAFFQKGWYGKTAEVCRWLIRLQPEDSGTALAWVRLGSSAFRLGDVDGAIRAWEEALRRGSSTASLYTNLGVAYAQQGAFEKAAQTWERGLPLVPEHSNLFTNLANLYLAMGRFGRAEAVCRQALERAPGRAQGYLDLAEAYRRQERREEAAAVLRRGLNAAGEKEKLQERIRELEGE